MSSTTNIGLHQPVALLRCIEVLAQAIGKDAKKTLWPIWPGDGLATYSDIKNLSRVQADGAHRGWDSSVRAVVSDILQGLNKGAIGVQ